MTNVLPLARQAEVFSHLNEGSGIRVTSRLTGVSAPTILRLLLLIATGYDRLHDRLVRNLSIDHIEGDELHSYVGTREINLPEVHAPEIGEQWVYTAAAKTCKLVISYAVGKRNQAMTSAFIADMRARLLTIPILSTDAYQGYPKAVGQVFDAIDYAQVVKAFGNGEGAPKDRRKRRRRRKQEAAKTGPKLMTKRVIWGAPDLDDCTTSHAERLNLSFRTHLRRLVRRGSGFSKSLKHHVASISVFVGFFNFCRVHMALRVTPAMQAGITDHVWSAEEFITACLSEPEGEAPSPQPLEPRPTFQGATRKTSTGVWLRAVPTPGAAPAPAIMTPAARQPNIFDWVKANPQKARANEETPLAKASKPLPEIGAQLNLFD